MMYHIVLLISIHVSYRDAIMVENVQPLDWDHLNSDQKYEFCGKSSICDFGFDFCSSDTVCD